MEHYKIIFDEDAVLEYLDWLPDLEFNEHYFLCLFSRKKYLTNAGIKSSDKTQLGRKTATKERILQKIRQMELAIGSWVINGMPAPEQSLVVYLGPNPRSQEKALWTLTRRLIDIAENNGAKGYNIAAEALSALQKSVSRKIITIFDIDEKEGVDLSKIYDFIPVEVAKNAVRVVETRGGYHLHIKSKMLKNAEGVDRMWYRGLIDTFPVDKSNPQFTAVPGCRQGTWVPRLLVPERDF